MTLEGKTTAWLDDFQSGIDVLRDEQREVRSLANLMYEAGNEKISRELAEVAENLHLAIEQVNKSIGTLLGQEIKRGNEASVNMLRAAMAGIAVATNDAELMRKVREIGGDVSGE